jgi:hypothetical protein
LLQTLRNHANPSHHFVSSISQFGKLFSCVCGLFPPFVANFVKSCTKAYKPWSSLC